MASPLTVIWPMVAALLAGLLGAVVMNVPMGLLPEGYTPAYVAGGVLRGRRPDAVGTALAVALHHIAGVLMGGGFLVVLLYLDRLMPRLIALPVAAILAAGFIYDFFSILVLPRAGFADDRTFSVRRQWGISAALYGVVLFVAFPVLVSLA